MYKQRPHRLVASKNENHAQMISSAKVVIFTCQTKENDNIIDFSVIFIGKLPNWHDVCNGVSRQSGSVGLTMTERFSCCWLLTKPSPNSSMYL